MARGHPPETRSELLEAKRLDLRVLAPAAYYSPFNLRAFEALIDKGVRALGEPRAIALSFRFDVLPAAVMTEPMPTGRELLEAMANRKSLHD